MMINALVLERQIPDIPVFVDSPLPTHVTEIFREHTACYDSEAAQFLAAHDNPFGFRRLPYIRDVEESKALNSLRRPCIMISASGMAEAGSVSHNLANNVLITGFQAANSLGRKLLNGQKEVNILGEPYRVRAEIVKINELSGHASQSKLLAWMGPISKGLKLVFLVHGEPAQQEALAALIRSRYDLPVTIPDTIPDSATPSPVNDRIPAMTRLCFGFGFALALFAREDVATLLEQKCLHCHGGALELGKLDLRTRAAVLRGGEHGATVVPGAAATSKLIRMVSGLDTPRMPLGGSLTETEIKLLTDWINAGAKYPDRPLLAKQSVVATEPPLRDADKKWWAFQPIAHPAATIDSLLHVGLSKKGLKPAPRADRATLVRRAYLDLIGLPPTPAEVDAFVSSKAPDAWPRLIDHLLASPHYGERWGRHWLDVARYADSNGYEHDFDRPNAWRYRDYVIRAFNADKPYDVFLTEQLAGDEVDRPTYDSLTATGFLRSYAKVGFREKDNPEFRYEYLDDMIATIGRGVMGLTVQCARCHDHKFDPISQKDYYRMQATLFGYVEVDQPLVPSVEAKAWREANARVDAAIAELRDRIRVLEAPYAAQILPNKYKRFPANVQEAIATPEAQRTPGQTLLANQVIRTTRASATEIDRICSPADLAARRQHNADIAALDKQRPAAGPMAMGVTDGDYRFTPDGPGDEPAPGKGIKAEAIAGSFLHEGPNRYSAPPSFLLVRGDRNAKSEPMRPGFLRVADWGGLPVEVPTATGQTSGRRLALARWLTAPENPLTARVMANRLWHHHFGRGIVPSLDNFGRMGDKPSNPELLDLLATELVNRQWSLKAMHRLIMTSETYQQTSAYEDPAALAADPTNKLLWRYPIRRLEAEIVRDQVLAVSGTLNATQFGPAIFPPLPAELLASSAKGIWNQQPDGPETWRRSVYVYRKRGLPFPMFETFDLPDQNIACGARNVSTAPTQALYLMNDPFLLRQAHLFAERIREAGGDPVATAFRLALARAPKPAERAAVANLDLDALAQVVLNLNEFLYLR